MSQVAPAVSSETNDPARRLKPRMIDSDWLVMRGMAREIGAMAAKLGKPGLTVIDFGCGSMPYRPLFQAAGCSYLGADFDGAPDIAIDAAGKMAAADASADLVVSFQVLEHVRDLDTYFSEARRVLKPDGRLVLSTHGTWLYHPHPEDHRRWTREGLVAEIEASGFVVDDCRPILGPLAWTTILRLTCWRYALNKVPVVGGLLGYAMSMIMNTRAVIEEAITPAWVTKDNACVYVTLCRPTGRLAVLKAFELLKEPKVRYLLVGGLCAGVHNAVMIGGAALGAHYVVSSLVSYVIVVVLGFLLHSHFTFSVGAEWRSFAKYAAAMALNYPIWLLLMFLLVDLAHLPMLIASPVGTVMMLAWNFTVSRWAILKPGPVAAATNPTPSSDAR